MTGRRNNNRCNGAFEGIGYIKTMSIHEKIKRASPVRADLENLNHSDPRDATFKKSRLAIAIAGEK